MSEDHMIQKRSPQKTTFPQVTACYICSSDTFYEFEIAFWQAQVCVNYTKGLYLR